MVNTIVGNEIVQVQGLDGAGRPAATTFPVTLAQIAALAAAGDGVYDTNTAISTVGNGTLTAASLLGGLISRSGPVAAFTDTTATAALIVAAIPAPVVAQSWYVNIRNLTNFTQTLAGGIGVTFNFGTTVPANSNATFLVKLTSLTAIDVYHVDTVPLYSMPTEALIGTADNGTTQTLTAAMISGANHTFHVTTGGTTPTLTLPAASAMDTALPNMRVGQSYLLRIINGNSGIATLASGTAFTASGTLTMAAATWREFVITKTATTTYTAASVGTGTNS